MSDDSLEAFVALILRERARNIDICVREMRETHRLARSYRTVAVRTEDGREVIASDRLHAG